MRSQVPAVQLPLTLVGRISVLPGSGYWLFPLYISPGGVSQFIMNCPDYGYQFTLMTHKTLSDCVHCMYLSKDRAGNTGHRKHDEYPDNYPTSSMNSR